MTCLRISAMAISVSIIASCLTPASERPAKDRAVGHAAAHGATIAVDDGLAAVREISDGAITLWAGAPVFSARVTFDAGAASTWALTMDNCLPDAALTATAKDGRPVVVTSAPGAFPTERRFEIARGGASEIAIRLRPPDADDPSAWRFAVLSDVQEAIDRVQDIYARMNQDPSIRFVLSAGDLTVSGTDAELDRYQRELRALRVPYYATLGNHDIASADGNYQRYFGRGSYRFVFRGVQFTLLDSASATIDPAVYEDLAGWLAEGKERVHVVAMHIPPLDPVGERNASFGSRAEAGALLSRLAEGRVDLTLYGHIHSYYTFENAGIPAFISGGGGAHPERLDGIGRHYLTVDIGAAGVVGTGVVRID